MALVLAASPLCALFLATTRSDDANKHDIVPEAHEPEKMRKDERFDVLQRELTG